MQLLNIYDYIDYINEAKQEDLPYPKFDMIYIYSKFLHLEITVDMVLVDKVFTNTVMQTCKIDNEIIESIHIESCNDIPLISRTLEFGKEPMRWLLGICFETIDDLLDMDVKINQNYYNDFCKQVMLDHEHADNYVKLIKKAFKRNEIDVDKISNVIIEDVKASLASMGIGNTTDIIN